METAIEPAEEGFKVTVIRPDRRHAIPAIQLFLEDLIADLGQIVKRLLVGLPLRQQVYSRFPSQVVQAQVPAGWIDPVQPVQKRLRRLHYNR